MHYIKDTELPIRLKNYSNPLQVLTAEKCITSTVDFQIWIFLSNLFHILLKNSIKEFTVFLRDQTGEKYIKWMKRALKKWRERKKPTWEVISFQIPQEYYSELCDLLLQPMQQFCQQSRSQFPYLSSFSLCVSDDVVKCAFPTDRESLSKETFLCLKSSVVLFSISCMQ